MKASFRSAVILCIICLLAACQKAHYITPEQTIDVTAAPTAEPTVLSEMNPASTGPTVQFLKESEFFEISPQTWLFSEPFDDTPFAVIVNCYGSESDVWAPYEGLLINNHCIIHNKYQPAYLVLYDGSILGLGAGSRIQVNYVQEVITEVILEKGEIYNLVTPQGKNRRFIVLVDGVGIEAKGTRFGVRLKDNVISVAVFDGKVITQRCLNWATSTCLEWDLVSVELLPMYLYTNKVGELDWTQGEQFNLENMVADPTFPVSRYLEPLLAKSVQYQDDTAFGIHADLENVETARSHLQEYLSTKISDIAFHDRIAGEMNLSNSDFCNYGFDACPMATPLPWIDNPFAPVQDGGNQSSSGGGATCPECPHQFDQSSCFTRSGHLWCFPVAGTVDPAFSAEWDITAICATYPGESYCAWVK